MENAGCCGGCWLLCALRHYDTFTLQSLRGVALVRRGQNGNISCCGVSLEYHGGVGDRGAWCSDIDEIANGNKYKQGSCYTYSYIERLVFGLLRHLFNSGFFSLVVIKVSFLYLFVILLLFLLFVNESREFVPFLVYIEWHSFFICTMACNCLLGIHGNLEVRHGIPILHQ